MNAILSEGPQSRGAFQSPPEHLIQSLSMGPKPGGGEREPLSFGGEADALKWHYEVRLRTGSLQGPQPIASLGTPVQVQHAAHGTRDFSVTSESTSLSVNHLC